MFIANKMLIINKVDSIKDGNKSIKKFRKLLKTKKLSKNLKLSKLKKLKSKKLFKLQNLTKLKKKLLKNRNSPNFYIIKTRPRFLIFDVNTIFNYLWLTLIKALIF